MKKSLIILNPAAHSDRASSLEEEIHSLSDGVEVRLSRMPGDAEQIARNALKENFSTIIAAGGDGTINEVVNGIVSSGISGVSLGILPVGTMNVFALELGIPLNSISKAWEIIQNGNLRHIDLPRCESGDGLRYFVQLAGVGLDAEVVRRTSRQSKKTFGPVSYLLSLTQVALRKPSRITMESHDGKLREGSFVLLGNGRFYGGPFTMFRRGSSSDGLLDVLVFQNQSPWDLLRYMHAILMGHHAELGDVEYFQTSSLRLHSNGIVPYELDGEMVGYLPLAFTLQQGALPVIVPAAR
ncbi:MAG: diacylglycerol kinase family protein [Verrucomicrobiota bacterium]